MHCRRERSDVRFVALALWAGTACAGLTRWLTGIGGRHARKEGEHFPAWAVLLHGLAGLATLILVLITATIMSQDWRRSVVRVRSCDG